MLEQILTTVMKVHATYLGPFIFFLVVLLISGNLIEVIKQSLVGTRKSGR